ncbi:MAG: 16S rRNA processing protein RimM [Bacteroidales bacterium]|nr:16S rRNA processing protein RimM [Bacteroidales bacterium]
MIELQSLLPIGKFTKPHGLKGEVALSLTADFDVEACECVIVPIEGIPVPFFVNDIRGKGLETLLFSIDDIDTADKAKMLCGPTVYVDKSLALSDEDDNDVMPVDMLIGFRMIDKHAGDIGVITDVDTSTPNVLLLVDDKMIPAADEYIVALDEKNRRLEVELPEGLLDI